MDGKVRIFTILVHVSKLWERDGSVTDTARAEMAEWHLSAAYQDPGDTK